MFERKVEVWPAYDKRNPDPHKNYGIHGATLKFLLFGPKGVIQFVIYTNWHLPHVQKELLHKCQGYHTKSDEFGFCSLEPRPADIGYHSPVPQYDGQTVVDEHCPYLNDKPCYYDGSTLNAEDVFKIMVEKGHEAMWKELENRYMYTFENQQ